MRVVLAGMEPGVEVSALCRKEGLIPTQNYGQLPSELQARVVAEVQQAKQRSDMKVRDSLRVLGVSVTTYYRWLREEAWKRKTARPVQALEALAEEKQAVKSHALEHPEIRHRELAWRMID